MSKFVEISKIVKILVVLSFIFSFNMFAEEGGDVNPYCDRLWKDVEPKVNELKKVLACDSRYTLQECRENIGLVAGVGIAAAAGAAAGFKASQKIEFRPPKFCGIQVVQSFWKLLLLPDVMAAVGNTCDSVAINGLLNELKGAVEADNALREFQAGKLIQEKLKKDNPKLVEAAKELEVLRKDYFNTGALDGSGVKIDDASIRARLKEFEKKYGVTPSLTLNGSCTGNADLCKKLTVIYHSFSDINSTEKARGAYRAFKSEIYTPEIEAHHVSIQKNNGFLKEMASGTVRSEKDLAQMIAKVGSNLHVVSTSKIIDIVENAKNLFPKSDSFKNLQAALHSKGGLGHSFESFMKSDLKLKMKRSLPAIILGLFPILASASGCKPGDLCYDGAVAIDKVSDATDPITWVRPVQGGCQEIYSTYSSLDSDCKEEKGFTPSMKSFLFADQDVQKQEICKSESFNGAISKLYDETFPRTLKVTCSPGKVTMFDKDYGNLIAQIDQQGKLLNLTYAGKYNDDLAGDGYILNFDHDENLKDIVKTSGRSRFGINSQNITRNLSSLDPFMSDLSTRLPVVMSSVEKCKSGNILASQNSSLSSGSTGSTTNSNK